MKYCLAFLLIAMIDLSVAEAQPKLSVSEVGYGWAANSVNTVVFRKNSLVTHGGWQYIAYYDSSSRVVIGKRKSSSSQWQLSQTQYKGNTLDAHNTISLMVDGDGFLHIAWDHHNHPLRYARSVSPGSLELGEKLPMTGKGEGKVSYPEFHKLANGDLIFLYRDGQSGAGNLVMNRYDLKSKSWSQIHANLIDGEQERNAYWQACIDSKGTFHISWVWRETGDVASNHDLCYAKSEDGGVTWKKSNGQSYQLPINAGNAEYVARIPQKSELINQTSIYADANGQPYIATYWRDSASSVPQYRVAFRDQQGWRVLNTNFRKEGFSLSGGGTKRIPISRPQIVAWTNKGVRSGLIVFRDEERQSKVSVALCENLAKPQWKISDLTSESVGSWEPTYDTELWKQKNELSLFVQFTDQKDSEGKSETAPTKVRVLTWKP